MMCLIGAPALSDFRLQRLLQQIRSIEPSVSSISTRYLYFIDQADGTEPDARLLSLLDAKDSFTASDSGSELNEVSVLIYPV